MVDGMPVPDAGGRPHVLSAARQQQIVTSARAAAAKGELGGSTDAGTALSGHAQVVGTLPPVKQGAGPIRPTGAKPLLVPPPSAASGAGPLSSISSIYGSTQVDNRGGCTSFGANESSVAQSTDNPNIVVVVFQMYRNPDGTCGDSHAWVAYSHDGGQHWLQTHPAVLSQPASGDTGVTYDASHHLFVMSYLEFNRSDDTQGRIAAEVSADGSSWSRDVTLASNNSTGSNDKPMITADNNPASPHYGRVVVTWTDFRSVGDEVLFDAYTDDGGLNWALGGSSINFTGETANGTSPAFDAGGNLMVAWYDFTGSSSTLREEYSTDGGATWPGSDVTITGVDAIGNPFTGSCTLNGGGSSFRCNSFPSLSGSPNIGGVGTTAFSVVWADVDSITQSSVTHNIAEIHEISTVNPTISSATWNFAVFGSFANFGDKFFPWTSFSLTDGRLNIGYLSREGDASTGNPQGLRFNQHETEAGSLCRLRGGCSGDQFITYTVDATLSNPGSSLFIGDYDGSSSYDRNFDSFPSWTDIRSGVNDVRTADLCYLNCYGFLSPNTPVLRSYATGSTFSDFWEINTDPAFGGSGPNFWNAVGLREGADGTAIDDDTFLAPNRYYDTALASSTFSPSFNDYLLVNTNTGHAPEGAYFPQVHSFSTVGGAYSVEWAYGHIVLGTSFGDSMAAANVIRVYDTLLSTGTTYHLGLRPSPSNTSIYTFALHSASSGNYQGAPGAAAVAHRTAAGVPSFLTFSTGVQPTQYDAVVVGNDNGGSGSYTLYRDTASPTASVSINGGAPATNNTNVALTIGGTNPTVGDPVLDMRISTDGTLDSEPWQAFNTSANVALPSGDGTKTVLVQTRNGAGAVSSIASDTIILDTVAPTNAALGTLVKFQKDTAFTVSWSATDAGSGIANYDLQERIATPISGYGAWITILSTTPSTSAVITANPGETRRYRIRARDFAGNVSAFSTGKSTAIPIDDASLSVAAGSWSRLTALSGTYLGTISRSTAAGAQLTTASITGRRIAVLVTKGPGYGTIEVRWNGVIQVTASLNNATTQKKKYIVLPVFGTVETGTLTITNSSGGTVDIDGVAIRRD
jgi:hypothetical protein